MGKEGGDREGGVIGEREGEFVREKRGQVSEGKGGGVNGVNGRDSLWGKGRRGEGEWEEEREVWS